jgi:hypothetical protein
MSSVVYVSLSVFPLIYFLPLFLSLLDYIFGDYVLFICM